MEKRKLAKPQSTETLENLDVYACEDTNSYCPSNTVSGCGAGSSGSGCPCPNIPLC